MKTKLKQKKHKKKIVNMKTWSISNLSHFRAYKWSAWKLNQLRLDDAIAILNLSHFRAYKRSTWKLNQLQSDDAIAIKII